MNSTFYFVLALTAVLASNAYGVVLDIDGDPIFRTGYYVLPVNGQGGGLTVAGRGDQPCPLDIVQESSEVDEGIPVIFSNWRSRAAFVPDSSNLNIETTVGATICIQSTYWQVGEFDEERRQDFVVAGPKPQGHGAASLKTFFKVVESGDGAYKFVFCPRACGSNGLKCDASNGLKCDDVGIFVDEKGVRRLALSDEPFLVVFKKVNVTEIASKFNTM